ncbi:efflux RND transporter periplasmic adaptor subunit [Tautonia rosea]|uniref:efflux RND transporter periplasmic adaptor subunit n=1 Tax=Tautonia rosea TaxID=2728037 RepID=UPI001473CA01|nr:efflux RND transporter periplasmic adaptor subunit [Tautonia rosea]
MSRMFSWLGNLIAYAVIAVILLAVLRPDLVEIPSLWSMLGEPESEAEETTGMIVVEDATSEDEDTESTSSASSDTPQYHTAVRLSSPEVAQRIGMQTATAERRTLVERVEGNAETEYDGHRYAEIVPRVACVVREVLADHGTKCQPGDRLAVVDSAEVGTAKANYLSARAMAELAEATLERTITLSASDALPKARELEARATLNTARADLLGATQRLRNFGFTEADLDQIAATNDTSSLLDVIAPIEGTIVDVHAVIGEALEPRTVMFLLTDLSTLWAWIDVPEAEYSLVSRGQSVTFDTKVGSESPSEGIVEWVDTSIDPVTRTVRVLAELENPEGRLRAKQFGWGSIAVAKPRESVVIPREAVQVVAPGTTVVFLDHADGSFLPRQVEIRSIREPGMVEVVQGLQPGETVVTTGAFFLMSELRREEMAGD